jgi:hypothetical protein
VTIVHGNGSTRRSVHDLRVDVEERAGHGDPGTRTIARRATDRTARSGSGDDAQRRWGDDDGERGSGDDAIGSDTCHEPVTGGLGDRDGELAAVTRGSEVGSDPRERMPRSARSRVFDVRAGSGVELRADVLSRRP